MLISNFHPASQRLSQIETANLFCSRVFSVVGLRVFYKYADQIFEWMKVGLMLSWLLIMLVGFYFLITDTGSTTSQSRRNFSWITCDGNVQTWWWWSFLLMKTSIASKPQEYWSLVTVLHTGLISTFQIISDFPFKVT